MSVFDYYANESTEHWVRLLHKEQDTKTLLELSAQLLELEPQDLEDAQDVKYALISAIWRVLDTEEPRDIPSEELQTGMDNLVVSLLFGNAHYGILLRDEQLRLDDKRSPLLRVRDAQDIPSLGEGSEYVATWEPYPTDGWPGDVANVIDYADIEDEVRDKITEQVKAAMSDPPRFLGGLRKMIDQGGDDDL